MLSDLMNQFGHCFSSVNKSTSSLSIHQTPKGFDLQFWKHEAVATHKVLSRIPQEKSDYRPDPNSRTAREIAWLIVLEERLLVDGLESGVIDWLDEPTPATVEEILNIYLLESGSPQWTIFATFF